MSQSSVYIQTKYKIVQCNIKNVLQPLAMNTHTHTYAQNSNTKPIICIDVANLPNAQTIIIIFLRSDSSFCVNNSVLNVHRTVVTIGSIHRFFHGTAPFLFSFLCFVSLFSLVSMLIFEKEISKMRVDLL